MAVGRFICVAIPLILTVAAIITALVATLSGVTHQGLPLFSINATGLSLNTNNLADLASKLNVRQLPKEIADKIPKEIADQIPPDLANKIPPELASKINPDNLPQLLANNVTAATLGIPLVTQVSLWGYCQLDRDGGSPNCTKPQFDWASTSLNSTTTILDTLTDAAGSSTRLPDEVRKALQAFRTITKWTEIAFVVALIALGLELLVGIFASCSRVASCLTWVIASIAAVLVGIAAGLATATASIVTGAVDAAGHSTGLDATAGKRFLATAWIAFAFASAAAIFWLLTICCCKPEHRSSSGFRSINGRRDDDRENLVSGGKGYAPVDYAHGSSGGLPQGQPGQAYSQYPPRYPSGTARPDMAYEPYSHRA
ncbi:integral membrane protein [Ophiocordyceps camponoti-floridani]|uniref:Integral membrane protein n=1 Tax=Ophiocordyceps camponoti-floridani TaxID=2030778 RepID=A0A8H4QA73_9HYPO|nr:integral membrane protein [Ophiocordyceps camponoti-floridani]